MPSLDRHSRPRAVGNKGSGPAGIVTENAFGPARRDQMHFRHPERRGWTLLRIRQQTPVSIWRGGPAGPAASPRSAVLGNPAHDAQAGTRLAPINPLGGGSLGHSLPGGLVG